MGAHSITTGTIFVDDRGMDAVPTDTWNRLPAARRAAVLAAAEAEFATNGFSRGSLNVIAREAGVAKGSLFQYFDDKVDLFAHLCDRAVERIGDAMGDQVDALDWSAGFFPACSELLAAWVEYFVEHPVDRSLSAAVFLEPDPEARSAARAIIDEHLLAFLQPILQDAQRDGFLRADADLDAFMALLLLVLPHLALAPSHPELDPLLGIGGSDPMKGVDRLIAVFDAAFGA
jgi:AcrR family transcriptional regulator